MNVPTDPEALVGRWQLTRRLADRRVGGNGRFAGELVLSVADDGLRWHESGQLTWGGRRTSAQRDYLLRRTAGEWWVHFADGRPFHPWTPGSPVEHVCVADTYRGR